MAKYRIRRTFASKEVLSRGAIIENPSWRNLGSLLRSGYVEVVKDEPPEVIVDSNELTISTLVEEKSRKELDIIAAKLGLIPSDYSNKSKIAKAIVEA